MKITMRVSKNGKRYELKFASGTKVVYVGSYAQRANAVNNGQGMLDRGEAAELFTRRKK